MTPLNSDIAAATKAQVETLIAATTVAADSVERVAAVQLKAARSSFDDGIKQIKALAAVKDPSELQAVTTKFVQPGLEKASGYAREVYETVSSAQAQLTKLLETQMAEFQKNATITLDGMLKNAPAGSEAFVATFKQAVGTASQAYDTIAKSAQNLGAMVEANLAATVPTGKKK